MLVEGGWATWKSRGHAMGLWAIRLAATSRIVIPITSADHCMVLRMPFIFDLPSGVCAIVGQHYPYS